MALELPIPVVTYTGGQRMSSFSTYLIGFIVLIVGLAVAAYLLGVPQMWIGVGVIVMIGIGILLEPAAQRPRIRRLRRKNRHSEWHEIVAVDLENTPLINVPPGLKKSRADRALARQFRCKGRVWSRRPRPGPRATSVRLPPPLSISTSRTSRSCP